MIRIAARDAESVDWAHRTLRRVYATLISIAIGVALHRLLIDGGPGAADPASILLAIVGAVAVGAALLVISASDAWLASLAPAAAPGALSRSLANGATWAALAALCVHFTGTAFAWFPGGAVGAGTVLGGLLGYATFRLHRHSIGHETYRTFNLVAMLLAAGSLASMSITSTGEWWSVNFSTLGTSDDFAAACFNVAVMVSGAGIALMSGALARGLEAREFEARRGGIHFVRWSIVAIGLSLVGVGAVPIDGDEVLHNVFACGAGGVFAILAVGAPFVGRRMPRTLVVLSGAFLGIEVVAYLGYDALGLFNLTVFEIVAFTLVFAWLIALVATTHAHADEQPVRAAEPAPVGPPLLVRELLPPRMRAGSAVPLASPFSGASRPIGNVPVMALFSSPRT